MSSMSSFCVCPWITVLGVADMERSDIGRQSSSLSSLQCERRMALKSRMLLSLN